MTYLGIAYVAMFIALVGVKYWDHNASRSDEILHLAIAMAIGMMWGVIVMLLLTGAVVYAASVLAKWIALLLRRLFAKETP